ncbi:MAG: 50S ribosomal protein L13 [Acidobacteriota bacterium]|nr:50S ribosomal protein L13 [Thermoanaerobaculaceae bacterium]
MSETCFAKKGEVVRKWYLVDAEGQTLGRLASQIARVLMGKHKPIFTPHTECGDFVVVVNAEKVSLTGRKWDEKIYRHHTMYPGGLREIAAKDLLQKNPTSLIEMAVRGMLPKTKIGDRLITKLKVYSGPKHPHDAQQPAPFPIHESKRGVK